ncbi:MAG TPA: DOPA 4,5-dioxygenase family protein [Hyphomicrobiaceae bacterium]|nr:DOPA 4,5-dioxygenase family protein [Hyphomicrobiaceae bacterium]
MAQISAYHAHVYFDAMTVEKARRICTECSQKFGLTMGRVHEKPVGPHPDWSCQLAFGPEKIGDVIGWLALNRDGLNVLIHPETGDALADHTRHAIWMGAIRPLDTSIFQKS